MSDYPRRQLDDPRHWIARMNEALATRNYDGVFVHRVSSQRETLRIIHRVKDGSMSERLSRRIRANSCAMVRNGWPISRPQGRDCRAAQSSQRFIAALNGLSRETEDFYDPYYVERQRLQA
jgi:negative regulator of sigma E activity